jgi:prolyl-tRNA editing enzyme YbaK/EbsC (Cys-tRNA(Pro) deacylase)/DNA-binding transcriptional MerR regulator
MPTPGEPEPVDESPLLTIGGLARRAGVPLSTIRYYENLGLLTPAMVVDGEAGYRPGAVQRVITIVLLLDVGCPVREVEQLVNARARAGPSGRVETWRGAAGRRIAELDRRITTSQRARSALDHALRCQHGEVVDCPGFGSEVAGSSPRQRSERPGPPMHDKIGTLDWVTATEHRDLLAAPVAHALDALDPADAAQVRVADIDPGLADTAAFCAAYDIGMDISANCVVVAGKRGGERTMAACLVLATTRADVNGVVRKRLDARKASFASMDDAVAETAMEYGGITPLGLPPGWPVLVDQAVADAGLVVIGSGLRRSKLLLPGEVAARLPGAEVVEGLAS